MKNIREPSEIIKHIREARRIETNMTATSIRQRMYDIRKSRGEKVSIFCDKFDKLIRQFEACNPGQTIQECERKAVFRHAVADGHPELANTYLSRSQQGDEMTTDQMQAFLLQREA